MNTKNFYNFLLSSSIALLVFGAGFGCYVILKEKEETKTQAIERSLLAYMTRPAYQFKTAIVKNDVAMAVDLLNQEALDLNHPYCEEHGKENLKEEPILMDAVRFNRLDIAKEMMKHPLNLYVTGETKRTPIEESIFLDNPEMLDVLLEKAEIDINKPYYNTNETLLHLAILYKAERVVDYLINKGASPMVANEQGILSIDYLTSQGQKDLLLKRYQAVQQEKKGVQALEQHLKPSEGIESATPAPDENEYRLKINAFMKMVEPELEDGKERN